MFNGKNYEKSFGAAIMSPKIEFSDFSMNKITYVCCLFVFAFLLTSPILAQEEVEEYPKDVVPPPLSFVSKDEKKKLNAETKLKNRTKLALELMDARLTRSKEFLEKNEYQKSLNEVGKFRGLLRNTLDYLKGFKGRRGSLKNLKKLEMHLRNFIPRLEIIRRKMPFKYGYHIKRTMFYVRKSRTKALNGLFDDTVIPEGSNL